MIWVSGKLEGRWVRTDGAGKVKVAVARLPWAPGPVSLWVEKDCRPT